MTIESLLLHSPAGHGDPSRGPAAWALGLAAAHRARLTGLVFELDVVKPRASGGKPSAEDDSAAIAAKAEQLRAAAQEAGVEADVVTDRSFAYGVPEIVADHARLHDLVVAGVDQAGLLSERSIAEHLLFEAGRPVVIVPAGFDAPFRCERVVVAWDWGRSSARALGDAMPLLREAKEITLVTFRDDDKRLDTSLDEERLRAALARRGLTVHCESAKRGGKPIGEALCDFALGRDADLLVMGGYGHSRLRQFVLGGATRAMLDGPGLPTLLSH